MIYLSEDLLRRKTCLQSAKINHPDVLTKIEFYEMHQ
jgi:hypothetical protein